MSSKAAYFPDTLPSTLQDGGSIGSQPEVLGAAVSTGDLLEPSSATTQIPDVSDEALMWQLRDGSKEALAVLFRRYARLVRAVAYRILRDGAEADDLVQEVFLFVFRKGHLFDAARGSARSWIVQVAYHRAIDRRRYLASRHFYNHLELSDTTMPESGRFYDQSMEGLLGRERLQEIEESLSSDQRNVLHLYFYEGYTLEEIAKAMAQTVGNVRNHYYRGLEKMRLGVFGAKFRTK